MQRLKSQNQRDIIKCKTRPRPLKWLIQTRPHMSTSLCGKICITPLKCIYTMKEGGTIILVVVLLLPAAPCSGDAVFHCESKTTLFGLPKEYTTRNQWLSCIYNTVPELFNPNIRVCAAHFTENYFLNLGE